MPFQINEGVLTKYIDEPDVSDVVIPDGVEVIGRRAFQGCGIVSIKLPADLKSIGREAFKSCERLEGICIPEGVTELEQGVFNGCFALKSAVLPDTLIVIGARAFAGCSSLISIGIPDSTEVIGNGAFTGCRMDSVRIPAGVKRVDLYSFNKVGCVEIAGVPEKFYFSACTEKSFEPPVVAPQIAFSSISADLKDNFLKGFFKKPDTFTGEVRRGYVEYLIQERKKILPQIMREDNAAVLRIYDDEGQITAENYEEGFLRPAQEAEAAQCIAWLLDWSARNVSFDDFLMQFELELGKDPYSEDEMEKLWEWRTLDDGTLCLTDYKGVEKDVVVPDHIGAAAVGALEAALFCPYRAGRDRERTSYFKEGLNSVTVKARLTALDDVVFSGCAALTSVSLREGLVSIGNRCFAWCGKLQDFKLPLSVETIGNGAFEGCPAGESG